jgi:hypothetical protein
VALHVHEVSCLPSLNESIFVGLSQFEEDLFKEIRGFTCMGEVVPSPYLAALDVMTRMASERCELGANSVGVELLLPFAHAVFRIDDCSYFRDPTTVAFMGAGTN